MVNQPPVKQYEARRKNHEFTTIERAQAKALALGLGGPVKAVPVLAQLWERVPSQVTVLKWVQDPRIIPDNGIVDALRQELQARAVNHATSALDKLGDRITREAEAGDALDIQRLTQAYATLYGLFVPKEQQEKVSVNVHGVAGGQSNVVIVPFRPRQITTQDPAEDIVPTTAS